MVDWLDYVAAGLTRSERLVDAETGGRCGPCSLDDPPWCGSAGLTDVDMRQSRTDNAPESALATASIGGRIVGIACDILLGLLPAPSPDARTIWTPAGHQRVPGSIASPTLPAVPGTPRSGHCCFAVPIQLDDVCFAFPLKGFRRFTSPTPRAKIWGQSIFLGVALTPKEQVSFGFFFRCFDFFVWEGVVMASAWSQ